MSENLDISASGPDLWRLLAVPAKGEDVVAGLEFSGDLHLVHQHPVKVVVSWVLQK